MEKVIHKHTECLASELWHSFSEEEVFNELKTSESGLTEEEVLKRLQFYGKNLLPEGKKVTLLQIILHQIINPLIFILIAAAIASIAIGESTDALFILLVIFLNSALGAYQEYNAEKSAANLQKLIKINARVRREGRVMEIPAEMIVPGDIVLLESGIKVPADLRLIDVQGLEIDESFLTGESIPSR
ncbi:MAG: cation-transporting P-type ATPase, partial [Bacteroidales bacterium]